MNTRTVTLILIGSHSGELDRHTIEATPCDDGDLFLSQILDIDRGGRMPDWIMSPGDRIVFEFAEAEPAAAPAAREATGVEDDAKIGRALDLSEFWKGIRDEGAQAFRDGKPIEACPCYVGHLGPQSVIEWRAGWTGEKES